MDNTITALDKIISERKDASPDTSYVAQLHHEGLNKILGKISEEEGHHPDINFGWGYVKINITTHAIKGLAESDFILAAKIDKIN